MKKSLPFRLAPHALILALLVALPVYSGQRWERAYGGMYDDVSYSVLQTRDGGYVACGWTASFGPGAPAHSNAYLVKTDSLSDTLWTRVYGGPYGDRGTSVQQTQDGGFIITGDSDPKGSGYFNVNLIKTDSLGYPLWTKTYLDTNLSVGNAVQQTRDTGYIIAGQMGGWDVYLVKTNSTGDTLWTRSFGGPYWDYGYSVQQTQDGGYIVAGEKKFLSDSSQVYLIKTDAAGDPLWSKTFGGSGYDGGYYVQQTQDGGYIIAGYHYLNRAFPFSGVYLIKTDAQGDTLWSKVYRGRYPDSVAIGFCVRQTQDGGYIVTGGSGPRGLGDRHVYLIKTDAQGDTLWTKTFGVMRFQQGHSVQQTTDGGYIIAGYTDFFGAGNFDVYLIKTDSLGNVGVEEFPKSVDAQLFTLSVRPSPVREGCVISFALPVSGKASLVVFDALGRRVRVLLDGKVGAGSKRVRWAGRDAQGRPLPSGVYFLRLEAGGAGGVSLTRKLVVLR